MCLICNGFCDICIKVEIYKMYWCDQTTINVVQVSRVFVKWVENVWSCLIDELVYTIKKEERFIF